VTKCLNRLPISGTLPRKRYLIDVCSLVADPTPPMTTVPPSLIKTFGFGRLGIESRSSVNARVPL